MFFAKGGYRSEPNASLKLVPRLSVAGIGLIPPGDSSVPKPKRNCRNFRRIRHALSELREQHNESETTVKTAQN